MKLTIGLIFFMALAFWCAIRWGNHAEHERYLAEKAACQANPTCREEKADQKARRKSTRSALPVTSDTGRLFYRGSPCNGNCSGHMQGYSWAAGLGATNDDACDGSESFRQGCLSYIDDRKDQIIKEWKDQWDRTGDQE